jgi:hypothetical protein
MSYTKTLNQDLINEAQQSLELNLKTALQIKELSTFQKLMITLAVGKTAFTSWGEITSIESEGGKNITVNELIESSLDILAAIIQTANLPNTINIDMIPTQRELTKMAADRNINLIWSDDTQIIPSVQPSNVV